MRIWVDLANSPQVLFFRPILSILTGRGHELLVTSRHFAQTAALAERMGIQTECLGGHGGGSMPRNAWANAQRVIQLMQWARHHRPIDLAVSHNSYSQAVAARLLNIPVVTLMDYEFQPLNHLCFRLARQVIVPECFPDKVLSRCGARGKVSKYPGFKEQVYLRKSANADDFVREFNLPRAAVMIAMRPPAPWAMYHRFDNPLFDTILRYLAQRHDTFIIFLPRVAAQADAARRSGYSNVWLPPRVLDGHALVQTADLVISGGGTMNREAAVLGTPAYTVFAGKQPAVDRELIRLGRMVAITAPSDIEKIRVEKKKLGVPLLDGSLDERLVDYILGS